MTVQYILSETNCCTHNNVRKIRAARGDDAHPKPMLTRYNHLRNLNYLPLSILSRYSLGVHPIIFLKTAKNEVRERKPHFSAMAMIVYL